MSFIEGFQFSLAAVTVLLVSYRLMLTVLALFKKETEHFETEKNRKFAIVLLAKSEESIARSLYSLSGMVYPKSMYELIVVTDNVANKSIKIAEKLGATVLVTDTKQDYDNEFDIPWVFEQILSWDVNQQFDAVIIFNADNLVAGNYLEAMNYYLEKGSSVIQGGYRALPKPENWRGEITRIEFLIHNYVLPLGNKILGFKAALKSNGTCFSTTILQKYAWQNHTKTSGIELGFMMQQDGIEIEFAKEAVIFVDASMGNSPQKTYSYSFLKNGYQFFKEALPSNKLPVIPIILTMYPTVTQVLSLIILMGTISFVTWSFGVASALFIGIWSVIAAIGIGQLYIGLKATGIEHKVLKALLYLPAYTFDQMKCSVQRLWESKGKTYRNNPDDEGHNSVNDKEQIVQ